MCTTRPGSADKADERGSHHEDGPSACPALSFPGDPVPVPHLGSQPQLLPPPSLPLRQKTSGPAKPDSLPAQHKPQTRGRGKRPNPPAQAGLKGPSPPGRGCTPPGPFPIRSQRATAAWRLLGLMRPGPGLAAAPSLSPYTSPSLSGAALGQGGPSAQGRPRSEPPHKHIKVKPASSVTEVFVFRCLPARSPREGRWPGAPLGDIFIPLVVSKHSGKKNHLFLFISFFPVAWLPAGTRLRPAERHWRGTRGRGCVLGGGTVWAVHCEATPGKRPSLGCVAMATRPAPAA